MMENVIEKQFIPYETNKGIDAGTLALLRDNDRPMETAALMNGGMGGFGNGMWNNPFMYLVWMWMMRWMNGNGEFGNGQGLANQLNNDANTNLIIRAIDNDHNALSQLATNLNCDVKSINTMLCDIKGAIGQVAGEVGYTGERVINAVQMGDCNIISKLQECCCTTQRSIDAVNLNLTRMGYEDQLAVQAQTNQLTTAMANGFNSLSQRIDSQSMAMTAGFQSVKDLFTQQKLDSLQALNTQYSNQLSQLAQTASIRELIDPIKAELATIQCGLPKQAVPAYPVSCGYPYATNYNGGFGYSGNGCSGC